MNTDNRDATGLFDGRQDSALTTGIVPIVPVVQFTRPSAGSHYRAGAAQGHGVSTEKYVANAHTPARPLAASG